jgi:leucyl-tRNA synthetase
VEVLRELAGYLKRTLGLVGVEVVTTEEVQAGGKEGEKGFSKHIVEIAEPGSPSYEFVNV